MDTSHSKSSVYFDGSCALCRAEINHYRQKDNNKDFLFVDVSELGAPLPPGMSRQQVMGRFHVRLDDGRILSGAEAFIEVWARILNWRWATKIASQPILMFGVELVYRTFLWIRPLASCLFRRALHLKALTKGVRRQ